jgi:hypothetical protein
MSAIGLSRRGTVPNLIGAHADFRPQDFRFPRTQSRSLSELEWGKRIKPMHSWGEIALYAMGATVFLAAVASMA